jgi:hypothetical protein
MCEVAVAAQPASSQISMADYIAILQLYAEHNTALDLGQGDRFAATFTEDGEFQGGRRPNRAEPLNVRKPDVVGRDQLRQMGDNAGRGSRHIVTNVVVTRTPDGAIGTSYLLLMNANDESVTETSIYNDIFVKTKDGWKFKKQINWSDLDPYTLYKPKPGLVRPGGPPGGGSPPGASPPPPAAATPPGGR